MHKPTYVHMRTQPLSCFKYTFPYKARNANAKSDASCMQYTENTGIYLSSVPAKDNILTEE